jgi:RNA polymerase sigma-70 factor (ECF subfamily)
MNNVQQVNVQHIIQRAKKGDRDAIAVLYQQYVSIIYRYIAYRIPTTTDAEDLTAEVFLKMVEGLPGYRLTGVPFEAWLYRIAAARVADFYRRKKPIGELSDSLTDSKPLPEEMLQNAQELDVLRRVLRQFSEEEQDILILRFVERKSHKEVAEIIGKSVTAVKSAQHRALIQLAGLFGEEKVRHYLRGTNE